MKIGYVEIGSQASIGESSTVLYDTVVGDRVLLGPLTLVAKGERLPPDTRWEGSPASAACEVTQVSTQPCVVAHRSISAAIQSEDC